MADIPYPSDGGIPECDRESVRTGLYGYRGYQGYRTIFPDGSITVHDKKVWMPTNAEKTLGRIVTREAYDKMTGFK